MIGPELIFVFLVIGVLLFVVGISSVYYGFVNQYPPFVIIGLVFVALGIMFGLVFEAQMGFWGNSIVETTNVTPTPESICSWVNNSTTSVLTCQR